MQQLFGTGGIIGGLNSWAFRGLMAKKVCRVQSKKKKAG